MVATPTPIHSLPLCDLSYDNNPPADIDALATSVDQVLPVYGTATPALQPTGLLWFNPTTKRLQMSDGTTLHVVAAMSEATQFITYSPGSNQDTSTGGAAAWVAMGNLTVPPWATQARFQLFVNGVFSVDAYAQAQVFVHIGSPGSPSGDYLSFYAASQRGSFGMAGMVTGLTAGAQSVQVTARPVAGGAIRADGAATFDLAVNFLP